MYLQETWHSGEGQDRWKEGIFGAMGDRRIFAQERKNPPCERPSGREANFKEANWLSYRIGDFVLLFPSKLSVEIEPHLPFLTLNIV